MSADETYRLTRLCDGIEAGTTYLRVTLAADHWARPVLTQIDVTVSTVRQEVALALLFGLEPPITDGERRLLQAAGLIHTTAIGQGHACPLCREGQPV